MRSGPPIHVGIDLSTTSARCLVRNHRLEVIGSGIARHTTLESGLAQRSSDWLDALRSSFAAATAEVDTNAISTIGIATQGVATVAVDERGAVLEDPVGWTDVAAAAGADIDRADWYVRSGRHLTPPFLAWRLMSGPRVDDARRWAFAGDYIGFQLTGQWTISPCLASSSGLIDPEARDWSDELLGRVGLDDARLSRVREPLGAPADAVGPLATELGLSPTTQVAHAAQDQRAAALVSDPDGSCISIAIGTAGAIVGTCRYGGIRERRIPVTPGLEPDTWNVEGVVAAAGLAFDWAARLCGFDSVLDFLECASSVSPGMASAQFDALLAGGGSPWWPDEPYAQLSRLDLSTDRAALCRAVIDGVAERIAYNARAIRSMAAVDGTRGEFETPVHLLGPATAHPAVSGSIVAALGCPARLVELEQPTATGAALIGACAAGYFPSLRTAVEALPDRTVRGTPGEQGGL